MTAEARPRYLLDLYCGGRVRIWLRQIFVVGQILRMEPIGLLIKFMQLLTELQYMQMARSLYASSIRVLQCAPLNVHVLTDAHAAWVSHAAAPTLLTSKDLRQRLLRVRCHDGEAI